MHVNHIPVEVLSDIFEFATSRWCPTNNDFFPVLQTFRTKSSPFNVIHVCRHWRYVAFLTPSLWTHLSGVQYAPYLKSVSAMSYWLQISRRAPLHFRISSRPDRKRGYDPQHARKMLLVFADHISRWETLSIEAGAELAKDLTTYLRDAGDYIPPLTGLEVELDYEKIPQPVVDELDQSCHCAVGP